MTKPMLVLPLTALVLMLTIGVVILRTPPRIDESTGNLIVRSLADMPAEDLRQLGETRLFFGHQSVGSNILDGVQDLMASHEGLQLEIRAAEKPLQPAGTGLVHAAVGRNREPLSKIAGFQEYLEGGLGEQVDIACLKFCYVDITNGTDPNALLMAYSEAIEALKSRFPDVRFMHFTVPLCAPSLTTKGVLRTKVKRLLRRATVLDDNAVRQQYNELLRERYDGKEPLFDLARYEAVDLEGQEHFCLWKNERVPVLVGSYTDDGGHLNTVGRQHIAEQLLIKLLEVAHEEE